MGHHEVIHSVNVICNLGKEKRNKNTTLSDTAPYSNRKTTETQVKSIPATHINIRNMCFCCSLQFAHLPSK